ncbi:MAG: nucleotidyl transferase AbiEii/AbiGii toxin family protein [Alphaproteobacteria bacterium]|nr:nucleotidyl transferase AbiEii/AbiGii toxin family protein [Alphaproteobacteria bacterium]
MPDTKKPEPKKNKGASVRARLLAISKANGQVFDLVLNRYAVERLLYRLSVSGHAERFVLKGATLLMTWLDAPHRGTRDLDLLGFGDSDGEKMLAVFREVMATDGDDGIVFDVNALTIERIREHLAYGGLRLVTTADIGGARVKISIDIGFGDALEPGTETLDYPVLLDMPAPQLRGYARETVIAEKFEAITSLGRDNSRMKDFHDIWILSRAFNFTDDRLALAIKATFARRGTPVPTAPPDALTPAFAADDRKRAQWIAFVETVDVDPGDLATILVDLSIFLLPHATAAQSL